MELNILGHKTCTICHLRKTCTQVVPGEGADPTQATMACIGEAPGQVEDEKTGRPLTGPSGVLLRGIMFDGMGLDLRRVFFSNVYHCRPPGNRIELAKDSICPTIWLPSELKRLPVLKTIVALGRTALTFFRPGTEHEPMQRLAARDSRWPDPNYGPYCVIGSYHPAAALHAGVEEGEREGNIILVSLVSSLQRALYYMDGVPYYEEDD